MNGHGNLRFVSKIPCPVCYFSGGGGILHSCQLDNGEILLVCDEDELSWRENDILDVQNAQFLTYRLSGSLKMTQELPQDPLININTFTQNYTYQCRYPILQDYSRLFVVYLLGTVKDKDNFPALQYDLLAVDIGGDELNIIHSGFGEMSLASIRASIKSMEISCRTLPLQTARALDALGAAVTALETTLGFAVSVTAEAHPDGTLLAQVLLPDEHYSVAAMLTISDALHDAVRPFGVDLDIIPDSDAAHTE